MSSGLLTNPYVFGILIAALTAVVMWGLQHSTTPDDTDAKKKVFYKTLAAGVVSAVVIAYALNRTSPISTEPFLPETTTPVTPSA
jgi:hypothetical protein